VKRGVGTAALVAGILAAGCSSGPERGGGPASLAGNRALLPGTQPYVQMTGAQKGYLVWPSGEAWVVLRTTTGFRQVSNRSPIAVDTEGGLIGDFSATLSAVAVGPTGGLYRSPVLIARAARPWTPAELPAAINNTRGSVAFRPGSGAQLSALTGAASGTVLLQRANRWDVLTTGRRLDPHGRLTLDSVTWLGPRTVIVTGHGGRGAPIAAQSSDSGRSWRRLPGLPAASVAALPPCGSARDWTLPVVTASDAQVVLRTSDAGGHWRAGHPIRAAAGEPAEGCAGSRVWAVGQVNTSRRLLVSTDAGGTWRATGTPPPDLTSLAPAAGGTGYATSSGSAPKLWRVLDDGRRFVRIRLPGWVASLGAQMSTS
jgi:hypothetical protein